MSFLNRIWARFLGQRDGGVLIEFTLVVPIVIGFGFAAIEFGNAFYGYQQMTTGVRDAARFLARFDNPSSKIPEAKTLAVTGLVSGSTQRLTWWTAANVNVTFATIANPINTTDGSQQYRGPDPLQIVRVSSTATYPGVGFLNVLGLGSAVSLSVYHEERVIHE